MSNPLNITLLKLLKLMATASMVGVEKGYSATLDDRRSYYQ
jgi:hypothetical protein